jgi:hypothetical protein
MGGYVICEYEKVKQEFPEFEYTMTSLRNALIAKGMKDWGLKWAGTRKIAEASALGMALSEPGPGLDSSPGLNEFGETTIIPALFRNISNVTLVTWNQWLNATGANVIMSGANGGNIYKDYKVGVAGLAFLDKAIRISEIKMQISDQKLPRINLEEAFGYNKPAIIFEEGYILDEQQGFDLTAYVLSQGPQRIKLIGLQVNKVKDKMLTNTGAALL